MPASTDITLPREVPAIFPDQCVVCEDTPDSTTKITQNSQHWLASFFFPIVMLFGWSRVEVPICRGCKFRFYFQRWGRLLVCYAFIIVVVWLAYPYFANLGRFAQKAAMLVTVIVFLSPYLLFEVFWPPFFTTTAQGKRVTYEFASLTYAAMFYVLNRRHVLESDIEIGFGDDVDDGNTEDTDSFWKPD